MLDSGYILKVEPLGFPDGMHMGKNDYKVSGLRNEKNGIVIT